MLFETLKKCQRLFPNLLWSANYAERAVDTRKNHETLNRTFRHPSRRCRARRGDHVPANDEVRITYDGMVGVVTPDSFIGSVLIEKWFGCSLLRREIHGHSVRAVLGCSFTHLVHEASLACGARGVVIQTIVRRCRDHNPIAVDVHVG
jgi:hypothetical protein